MVVGYGLKDLVVEVISATQIRFGFYLSEPDILVSSIEIVGLEIVEDATASANLSYSVGGTTQPTKTTITGGKQFTYSTAIDTDEFGLFYVTADLTSPFTSTLTVDYTSLKVNNVLVPTTGVNMSLTVPDNPPSLVSSIPDDSVNEDDAYSFDAGAHFSDDATDTLTFTLDGAPSTLSINSDGLITGTPVDADVGTHTIKVTAKDGDNNLVDDTFVLTVVDVNNAATGVPTISGSLTVGSDLTIDTSAIADADGLTGVSYTYEWFRTDTSDVTTKISGATTNTYTLTETDLNYNISAKVSFSDDEGQTESASSVETAVITQPNYVFDIQNVQLMTAAEASKEINTALKSIEADATNGSQEQIIKFDLYVDATALPELSSTADVIEGFELQLGLDATKLESMGSLLLGGDVSSMMQAIPSAGMTSEVNTVTGNLAGGSSLYPLVDNDSTNDSTTYVMAERKVFTIYLNPKADVQSLDLGFSNMKLGVGESVALIPQNYAETIDLGAKSQIVDGGNNAIINTALSFDQSGASQGTLTTDANGELTIQQVVDFDAITLVDPSVYTDGVDILDAVAVLKDIVGLASLGTTGAEFHAADTNNDGSVDILDAVNILKHIVKLSDLDSFDLVDENGDRITKLDPSLGIGNEWELVANGDVNGSGSFDDGYLLSLDVL